MIVALIVACGPDAQEVPEVQPWMSGIWSQTPLMTTALQTPGPDGGLGENIKHQPGRYEIFGDGTYEAFSLVKPGTFATFASTWEIVSETEIRAAPHDNTDDSTVAYLWELGTGERGCDAIVFTILAEDGDRSSYNLYRGAICTVQREPCPPDVSPPHNCFYYHYQWCDEQGANEPWMIDNRGEDAYCHLPGYEDDE